VPAIWKTVYDPETGQEVKENQAKAGDTVEYRIHVSNISEERDGIGTTIIDPLPSKVTFKDFKLPEGKFEFIDSSGKTDTRMEPVGYAHYDGASHTIFWTIPAAEQCLVPAADGGYAAGTDSTELPYKAIPSAKTVADCTTAGGLWYTGQMPNSIPMMTAEGAINWYMTVHVQLNDDVKPGDNLKNYIRHTVSDNCVVDPDGFVDCAPGTSWQCDPNDPTCHTNRVDLCYQPNLVGFGTSPADDPYACYVTTTVVAPLGLAPTGVALMLLILLLIIAAAVGIYLGSKKKYRGRRVRV
jgi:uncharacterized repeat protein (TIGR01451 family)